MKNFSTSANMPPVGFIKSTSKTNRISHNVHTFYDLTMCEKHTNVHILNKLECVLSYPLSELLF